MTRAEAGSLARTGGLVAILMAAATSAAPPAAGALAGLSLALLALDRPSRRGAWIAGVGSAQALVGGAVAAGFGLQPGQAGTLMLRCLAGAACCGWWSGAVGWLRLARALRASGVRASALAWVDHPARSGMALAAELAARRELACVRGAGVTVATAGRVLASGLDGAYARSLGRAEATTWRGAPPPGGPARGQVAAPALRLRGMSRRAPDGRVLLEISHLTVAAGEVVAVLGPSGSGKTTLLRLAAGLDSPLEGAVERFGHDATAGRRGGEVALVPQDPDDAILGSTPREDLLWGLAQRGLEGPAAAAAAEALLGEVGLRHAAETPIPGLSGGEKRRLALAGALASEPHLLLCDEPTAALDPRSAAGVTWLIGRAAAARGMAVLWVTHEPAHLPAACRRVLLLRDGHVAFDGPPAEALSPGRLAAAGLTATHEVPT
jgi:ABC-type multidrug transport system ATPase subunit